MPKSSRDHIILQLIMGDAATMCSLEGLSVLLDLCKINKKYSEMFSCQSEEVWRNAYEYIRNTTIVRKDGASKSYGIFLLPTPSYIKIKLEKANTTTSRVTIYKKAVIKFVIFRLVNGPVAYKNPQEADIDKPAAFLLGQVHTYLNRKNGSAKQVVKEIKYFFSAVDSPIPTQFVVEFLHFIRDCVTNGGYSGSITKYWGIDDILKLIRAQEHF